MLRLEMMLGARGMVLGRVGCREHGCWKVGSMNGGGFWSHIGLMALGFFFPLKRHWDGPLFLSP